ncbi:hypothetical protein [Hyphomicrobium sp.]|jgi:hypothetical protein|uniref:hypothetical protein n=1 Tax=Hyphomicrobium sp. TaxID=82 RepID=UPI002B873E7A|nr:hypothetical protein [Hyphomicrobium sp.]HVZ04726.1 hypothetical protein [Hyphomicrobium sp.]
MNCATTDSELLQQLSGIPEIDLCGFSVREGLSGRGVTMHKGRSYFGSWRAAPNGELIWTFADLNEPGRTVATVEEAVRYTLLLILRNLENKSDSAPKQARAG